MQNKDNERALSSELDGMVFLVQMHGGTSDWLKQKARMRIFTNIYNLSCIYTYQLYATRSANAQSTNLHIIQDPYIFPQHPPPPPPPLFTHKQTEEILMCGYESICIYYISIPCYTRVTRAQPYSYMFCMVQGCGCPVRARLHNVE